MEYYLEHRESITEVYACSVLKTFSSYLLTAPPVTGYWAGWTPGLTQNFHLLFGGFSIAGLYCRVIH